ncbi:protease Do-like 5, chloroplastic [Silene latifolia]|uniref:protease Do-like 5, chloroplastic n=1 Tax=Silene latifolia TaxID=37657 RepID=UPI003D771B27
MVAIQGCGHRLPSSTIHEIAMNSRPHSDTQLSNTLRYSRRNTIFLTASLSTVLLNSNNNFPLPFFSSAAAREFDEDEEFRVIRLFQETSPSVVFIKLLKLSNSDNSRTTFLTDDSDAKVEGTGSGFIWDKTGHIVTNYHVVANLASDTSGLQCCKVMLVDNEGNKISAEGKIVGLDPSYDLAVLKVNIEGIEIKPAALGTSQQLRVGQTCFAIGNPYGYENTLTTGVVSGLGREIPSPNGQAIRGAIQTDAAINAGNSGGPLTDAYGHVIGVNTATFTRKGSGMSSGINFAIPIDTVVKTVPALIVYGTAYRDRY